LAAAVKVVPAAWQSPPFCFVYPVFLYDLSLAITVSLLYHFTGAMLARIALRDKWVVNVYWDML
jgi:hypothetical protein